MDATTLQARFGERVKYWREKRGFSQEGFALAMNLSRSHFGKIERGRQNVCLDTVARIATGLDVDPCELFKPPKPGKT